MEKNTCPECNSGVKSYVGWVAGIKVVITECLSCEYMGFKEFM